MAQELMYTAFEGNKLFGKGSFPEVALKVKKRLGKDDNSSILLFSNATGRVMDFNFQGTKEDVLKRLEVFASNESSDKQGHSGPGRPKLGVISREVSLLPRHWEWLATQSTGASATLRRLVEEAKKKTGEGNSAKQSQERTYNFMSVMGGDLKGFEEALRALYKKDKRAFLLEVKEWPADVKEHALQLANAAFRSA